jgi:hypothetical protein
VFTPVQTATVGAPTTAPTPQTTDLKSPSSTSSAAFTVTETVGVAVAAIVFTGTLCVFVHYYHCSMNKAAVVPLETISR